MRLKIFFGMVLTCATLPAYAADAVGTDYLMTHSTVDAQSLVSNKQARNRSLAQASTGTAPAANTQELPGQILRTGVSLTASDLSPNGMQLSDNIGLTSVLERIDALRGKTDANDRTFDGMVAKQELLDCKQKARLIVQRAKLEIDFALAEINAERQVYNEILGTFKSDRDKAVARTNAFAFISNGILWAVCESFVIPTYKYPIYNIPAGIIGIPAGVVPSLASMYTFKQINGKKMPSEVEPNMLAKLFDYPVNSEIEYPKSVWTYLNQIPADAPSSKKRLEQMVDRWIADSNMKDFNDRQCKKQLDVLTASVSHKKGLTIGILTARTIMLDQLEAEVCKMKRMLLELDMAALGDKRLIAAKP